jgi:DNA-directed RNA polymerase specialized sigma subunit
LLSFDDLIKEKPRGAGGNVSALTRKLTRLSMPEKEKQVLVEKVMSSLRETERLVVALRFYEGMGFEEIAEALVIPEGRVARSYSRMVEKLSRIAGREKPERRPGAQRGKLKKAS